jgi:hypothetical protein
VVDFANDQYEKGNYDIASKEYNRAYFFGYEPKAVLCLQIAHCYQQLSNNTLAEDFYDKAYRFAQTDSLKAEAILGKAYCLLIDNNYILSISELLNLPENCTAEQQISYHFLKAIAHYGSQQDSASLTEFLEVAQLSKFTEEEKALIKSEFATVFHYNKKYNPKRAYIFSGIVPGSGQLSVGAIKDGINSMLLVGGLYILAINVVINYSFWDAFIALFPWVQRYYLGGMDKAKALAIAKIEEKRNESYLKIIELTTPTNFQ